MAGDAFETLLVELAGEVRGRFWGKYRGTVVDVDDPLTIGRVRASVPSVLADADSPWAMPCVAFAGDGHGLVLLPEVGDGVWIEFEGGDPALPVWTGCWWSTALPDPGAAKVRALVTTGGLKVVLDDDANELKLVHPGGAEVKLGQSEISIAIGSAKVVLSSAGVSVNDGAFKVS
jgi:hypothetical protein